MIDRQHQPTPATGGRTLGLWPLKVKWLVFEFVFVNSEQFYDEPMLQREGWIQPGQLENVVMENVWDEGKAAEAHNRTDSK